MMEVGYVLKIFFHIKFQDHVRSGASVTPTWEISTTTMIIPLMKQN